MATLGRQGWRLPGSSKIISQCVRNASWNQMGPSGDRHSPIVTSKTADINQERYSERTVGKRQKVQAQEVTIASKPDAVSEFQQKKAAVKETASKDFGPLTEERMPSSFSTTSAEYMSRPQGVQNGHPTNAPLEHSSGWGAQWQQGGTGSGRNRFGYAPNYSQGAGDRDLYIGNLRSNKMAFFPNNSQRLSNGKIEDHTKPWGNYEFDLDLRKKREAVMDLNIGVKKQLMLKYETGKVDEWGNVRGHIQRPVPKDHVFGTDKKGRYVY